MKNLGELKEAIEGTLNRSDIREELPRFIKLTEAEIFRVLRTRDNEFLTTITATNPNDPALPEDQVRPANPITLPDNYLEMILITIDGQPLTRVSDASLRTAQKYDRAAAAINRARCFSEAERKLVIYPWPDDPAYEWDGETIVLKYYGSESLNELAPHNTPTNPLEDGDQIEDRATYTGQDDLNTTRALRRFPDAFLYGALFHAAMYLQAPNQQMQTYRTLFQGGLSDIKRESRQAAYSGSTLSIKSRDGELTQSARSANYQGY